MSDKFVIKYCGQYVKSFERMTDKKSSAMLFDSIYTAREFYDSWKSQIQLTDRFYVSLVKVSVKETMNDEIEDVMRLSEKS